MIGRRWGTSINPLVISGNYDYKPINKTFKEYENEYELARTVPNIEDTVATNGKL